MGTDINSQSEFSRLRQEILAVREDDSFQNGLEQTLGGDSCCTLNKRLEKLNDENLYAAFIGRQGVGKSSLINALLFTTEILPIDVTETTNVICKVVHTHGRNAIAEVLFTNGSTEKGPPTREFLADYVDEQLNTGNEKKVKEILIRYPIPYLSDGIAFVDTPGVGSLLSHNMRTTMEFLPKISCAIFVFSTTPSILGPEVEFLRATWSFAQNFFFVQNVWGEDHTNISGSQKLNLEIIRKLAVEMGTNPDALRVFPVDIYAALDGARNNDSEMTATSGAAALSEGIRLLLNMGGGKLRLLEGTNTVGMYASRMQRGCVDRLNSLRNKGNEEDQSFREKIDEEKDDLSQIEGEWNDAKNRFDDACRNMERDFDQNLEDKLEVARSELKNLLDEGSIDAERFGKAITEKIQVKARAAHEPLDRSFRATAQALVDAFVQGMESTSAIGAIANYQPLAEESVGLYQTGENIGGVVNWAGGLGVMYAAGAAVWAGGAVIVAGEGIAAGIAAAGAAVPGVGWVIAGVALVGGWLFKKYSSGKKIQQLHTLLDDAINESRQAIRKSVGKAFRNRASEIKHQLNEDITNQIDEKRELLRKLEQDRSLNKEERERLIIEISEYQKISGKIENRFFQIREEVMNI